MSKENNKEIAITVPGEWVIKKVLGPVLDELGSDFKKLYSIGRDKIVLSAIKKIKNPEDGARANLRVARDVFWNGSFTDEAICAEYFGGILASSRSSDGKDDRGIYYLDIIKSFSSNQLRLHYIIYHALNKLLVATPEKGNLNIGMSSELQNEELWFSRGEFEEIGLKIEADLTALYCKGLIGSFKYNVHKLKNGELFYYIKIAPTILGVHLFAIAFNSFSDWRKFAKKDFGDFESIKVPIYYSFSIEGLLNTIFGKE